MGARWRWSDELAREDSASFSANVPAGSMTVSSRSPPVSSGRISSSLSGFSPTPGGGGIAVDDTGVYTCGQVFGDLPGQTHGSGYSDAWVRKYDLDGNELWTDEFGSLVGWDAAKGLCLYENALYVCGRLHPGTGAAMITNPFVRKYDLVGNVVWTKEFTVPALEHPRGITADPNDAELRRLLLDVLSCLRKSNQTSEAGELCLWAQEAIGSPSFTDVLVLEQALIAGRDQKNYAMAIRLCDSISGPGHETERAVVARYLAGSFCLAKRDYGETVARMEALLAEDMASAKYRVRAASLLANAYSRLGKPQKGVSAIRACLATLTQPEPADAADCRKTLYTMLLSSQQYGEAAEECRLLVQLHPGTDSAKAARATLAQLERSRGATSQ